MRIGAVARGPLLAAVALVAACAQLPVEPLVQQPMTARPLPAQQQPAPALAGAIYQAGARGHALFEDRRPRHIGDILTIVISEKADASKASATSASRNGKASADFGVTPRFLGGLLRGQDASMAGENSLSAKGGANAANTFNGVITVTVVEVVPNGNLVVSGEKQMLINQGTEFIRFSGVVNPHTVVGTNTVLSTQVADARIEFSSKGFIHEAQTMGWLQRFFLNVLPF
jgi:flagellar L-ring protein FlgH